MELVDAVEVLGLGDEHQVGVAARADEARSACSRWSAREVLAGGEELALVRRALGGVQPAPGGVDLQEGVLDEVTLRHVTDDDSGLVTRPVLGRCLRRPARLRATAAARPCVTLAFVAAAWPSSARCARRSPAPRASVGVLSATAGPLRRDAGAARHHAGHADVAAAYNPDEAPPRARRARRRDRGLARRSCAAPTRRPPRSPPGCWPPRCRAARVRRAGVGAARRWPPPTAPGASAARSAGSDATVVVTPACRPAPRCGASRPPRDRDTLLDRARGIAARAAARAAAAAAGGGGRAGAAAAR